MTAGRAALIGLIDHYALPWYRVTLFEIQKLAYFLQAAGEPLKLDFVKGKYGPYAENLHHVLQRIEGHFIRGYGDRSRAASIQLLSGAREEATGFLASNSDTQSRLERVSALKPRTALSFWRLYIGWQPRTFPPGRIRMPQSQVFRRGMSTKSSHSTRNMFGQPQ